MTDPAETNKRTGLPSRGAGSRRRSWVLPAHLLDLPALSAVECLRCLGERGHRSRRDDGRERALQHRQHLSSRPRLSGGRKRGIHQRALGRSRGGFTSKVHCLGDARGRPIAFHVTPGEAADCKSYDTLINLPERIGLRCRIILLGRPSSRFLARVLLSRCDNPEH
jgi:hypothetical protein